MEISLTLHNVWKGISVSSGQGNCPAAQLRPHQSTVVSSRSLLAYNHQCKGTFHHWAQMLGTFYHSKPVKGIYILMINIKAQLTCNGKGHSILTTNVRGPSLLIIHGRGSFSLLISILKSSPFDLQFH